MQQLEALRSSAMRDPAAYVTSLITNTGPKAPAQQPVSELPRIHIEPYLSCADPVAVQTYMAAVGAEGEQVRACVARPRSGRMAWSARSSARVSRKPSMAGVSRMAVTAAPSVKATPRASPVHGPTLVAPPVEPVKPVTETTNIVETAATVEVTNTSESRVAGKSQKALTPQMLETLRRQASLERSVSPPLTMTAPEIVSAPVEQSQQLTDHNEWMLQLGTGSAEASGSGSGAVATQITPVKRKRGRPPKPGGPTERRRQEKQMGVKVKRPTERRRPPTAVRRRHDDTGEERPASFNVPWSDEEQQRLEQLLGEYPEEEVANSRWRKIAEALGTRTMRQVASRVQKYFIKLAKAGLPVPGRDSEPVQWPPMVDTPPRRSVAGTSRRRKSIEFTSSEDDDIDDDEGDVAEFEMTAAMTEPEPQQFQQSPVAQQPQMFAQPQFMTPALQSAKAVHLGYRCDSCLAEPIVGIRWHCQDCRGAQTVDLCDDCMEEGAFETPWHSAVHNFHAYRDAEMDPYYAADVGASALREYSYLA
ncbi:ZZ-type zinc finger-containing protein 3 [Linderina macrospora]|uniref:ZZ-type zinc finger-containing protein 3 n=1 Tax=Linderina macrospora TaxID=4868 RepID=A0ACC1JF91_9FUNG|nr:ZZ-type zinc finger-containing protein 3 [Linderina macrospora]